MKKKFSILFTFIIIQLVFIGSFNYLLDPYGKYGTDILNMNRIDSRSYIVRKLDIGFRESNFFLFGSSRSLGLNLGSSQTYRFKNLALEGGTIEDYYCILRYAVDVLNYPVRAVAVGLESDLMVSSHPTDTMLQKNKQLAVFLEMDKQSGIQSYFTDPEFIKEIGTLLSITTLTDSCRLLFHFLMNNLGVKEAGAFDKKTIMKAIVKQKDSMEARLRQYKGLYAGSVIIDPKRILYLNKFAKYAEKKKIKVVMFYPGYSNEFWDAMNSIEAFRNIQSSLDSIVERVANTYQWKILDFRPDNWRGPQLTFFDGVHPDKKSNKIISRTISEYF